MWIISVCLFGMTLFTKYFLQMNERRESKLVQLNDPLLQYIPTHNMSTTIACLEIFTGLVTFQHIYTRFGWFAYEMFWFKFMIISYIKVITLWLVPLAPPTTVKPLKDTFIDTFMGTTKKPLTKDLFFSGHTSFMVASLMSGNSEYVLFYWLAVLLMSVLLLINHVHYSIDIFIAPFVVFTVYTLSETFLLENRLEYVDRYMTDFLF
jgi:hypothetical protein